MSNRWKFAGAYAVLVVLAVAIAAITGYALLRNAPPRHAQLPVWWHGLSKAEIAVELESGRAPVRPDGAGPLVVGCFPKGPRMCVVRLVANNHLLLLYVQVEGDVFTLVHTEDLTAGSAVPTP